MNSIVCIKQVPESKEVRVDKKTGKIIREGIPSVINPSDCHALEAALQLKDLCGGTVSVISMGPLQAETALREALAMGADHAYLLCDMRFGGADTAATSYVLGRGIQKIGEYDLVLCGIEAIDGCTAQVGPEIAEMLGIPQITYAHVLTPCGKKIQVERTMDGITELLESDYPIVVTVSQEANTPRIIPLDCVLEAYRKKDVVIWNAEEIEADTKKIGAAGSKTQTRGMDQVKPARADVTLLGGTIDKAVASLVKEFSKRNLL